jgi:hypothetical protein
LIYFTDRSAYVCVGLMYQQLFISVNPSIPENRGSML